MTNEKFSDNEVNVSPVSKDAMAEVMELKKRLAELQQKEVDNSASSVVSSTDWNKTNEVTYIGDPYIGDPYPAEATTAFSNTETITSDKVKGPNLDALRNEISEMKKDVIDSSIEQNEIVPVKKSILDSIKIDLNNINIGSENNSTLVLLNNSKYTNKSTMQVVACQSAYAARISALTNQEIQNIIDSDIDLYAYKKRLYQVLWNHIEDTSVGKMNFITWMTNTSFFDLDTLLYGLYCQTFPYENKYTITCPSSSCRSEFEVVTNNSTLTEMRADTFEKINEVVSSIRKPEDLVKSSLVHTTKRVCLDESKIIVDLQIPSIHDYLEGTLSKLSSKMAEEYSETASITLFIKNLYIPDLDKYSNTGELQFIPITDKTEVLKIISDISFYDASQLSDCINEFTRQYRVSYSLKNIICPHCGHKFENIPMDMETLIFIAVRMGASVKERKRITTNI